MKKSQIYTFYGIILTSILAFYGMNMIVPFYNDDLLAQYNYIVPQTYITSTTDIIQAVIQDYYIVCGRVVSSFFCHLFPTLIGEKIFNIVNTLFWGALLGLGYNFCKPQNAYFHWPTLLWFIMGCFLLSCDESSLFHWMAGGINYLWSWVAILLFLKIFHTNHRTLTALSTKAYPLLAVSTMLVALFHEMFALTISGALFIAYVQAYLFPKMQPILPKLDKRHHWLSGGYWIGSFIAIFSPSMIGRAAEANQAFTIMKMMNKLIKVSLSLQFTFIFLILLTFIYLRHRNIFLQFIKANVFYLLCLLFSIIPAVIAGEGGRAVFATEAFAILLSIRLWNDYNAPSSHQSQRWLPILGVFFAVFYGFIMYESHLKWHEYKQTVTQYMNQKRSIVSYSYFKGMPIINLFTIDVEKIMRISGVRHSLWQDKERVTGKSALPIIAVDKRELEDMKQSHTFFIPQNHVAGAFYTRDGYPDYIARYDSTLIKNIAEERLYCVFSLPFNLPFNLKVNYLKSDFYAAVPIRVVGNKKKGRFILLSKNYKHFPMTKLLDMGISKKANTQKFEFVSY